MNQRKVIAVIVAVLAFFGLMVLIGTVVQAIWPGYWFSHHPIERFFTLIIIVIITSKIYNIIKGKEPEQEV